MLPLFDGVMIEAGMIRAAHYKQKMVFYKHEMLRARNLKTSCAFGMSSGDVGEGAELRVVNVPQMRGIGHWHWWYRACLTSAVFAVSIDLILIDIL